MMFNVYMLIGIAADAIEWHAGRLGEWATRRSWSTRTARRWSHEADQ